MNRKAFTLIFFFLLLISIMILMGSCSGAWHLRQSVKKGIVVKSDTIYQEIVTKGSTTTVRDTVYDFTYKVRVDTFKTETVKWRLKLKYDTITNTVFTQVECLPDTIRVPVTITNDFDDVIQKSKWYVWVAISLALVLVIILVLKFIK